MEVSISNFRGISSASYSFLTGTNLLKGESGTGKTTIFEAIKWCLYGGTREIYHWDENRKNQKIKVIIKVGNYIITRTNRPAKVIVEKKDKLYQSDEAVEKIISIFGTKALWETCSYLAQDQRNFLLQASQKEKTEVIKELLFDMTEEGSEWYKDKFEKYKEILKVENSNKEGKIEALRETFEYQSIEEKEIDKAKKEKQNLLLYDKIEKKYNKIKLKIDEYEKFKEMKNERDTQKKKLDKYPFPLGMKKFNLWQEYDLLRSELSQIKNKKKTKLSRSEILENKQIVKNNIKILKKYDLEYQDQVKSLYQEKLNMMKKYLLMQKNNQNRKKISKLRKKISKLKSDLNSVEEELSEVRERKIFSEISKNNFPDETKCSIYLKRMKEILAGKKIKCPSCGQDLLIDENDQLKISEVKNGKEKTKIKTIEWMLDVKDKYITIKKELELINRELSSIDQEEDCEIEQLTDIDDLEQDCQILNSYNYEVEIEDMEPYLNYLRSKEIKQRMDQIRFPGCDHAFPDFPCDLAETSEDYIEGYLEAKNKIEEYDSFIERYEIIDEDQYLGKLEKIQEIEKELQSLDRLKDVLKHLEVKQNLKQIGKNNEKINKASILAGKVENLVNQNLELFLTDFNNMINEVVSSLIDQMSVKLTLFKTTKVTKKTKCNVNVEINYKGHQITNFSSLSGGQKNRLSLAFTLVFSKICGAKFIILDEFMSSLDEDLRYKCLEIVKRFSKDTIVVNVCHETVEGYYDNMIELSE